MTEKSDEIQSLSSAQGWVEQLTVTIETPKKHSKLFCSLEQSIENGIEAYNDGNKEAAEAALKTAQILSESIIEKQWTDDEEEEKINTYILPAINDALTELNQKDKISV